ncbi:DUF4283 domain-containing protein [Citrus sinensis]|uniref:uncharacterized protein LOC107177138 n=1 Tax=Citrus sinensis TaxID=2711 RepID=UPI00219C066D|nr:uncharacterized protein LOC107177138 [Citrus sinensis]KAH9743054.1 DUF4283 domain-containing protein [Citrus sinensis]
MESSEKSRRGKNPSAGGIFPPPFRESRTTKKARFRDEEVADDTPVHVSYKETLVNSSRAMETGYDGGAGDWEFEEGDVTEYKDGPMPSITFSDRVHEKLCEPWQNSVIVKLLGRTIGYRTLCTRLNAMWKTTMTYSVIDLENNYFLVRFRSATDAVDALTKGPWIIMGHYLTVQPWTPSFDANTTDIEQVNVWIRLPGLAVHLYNRKVLQKLGELVGTVMRIDSNTASSARGRFARIAVRLSLAKPLVSQFVLDGKVQKVEYEGLPVICFTCGRYGHSSSSCKGSNSATNSGEGVQPQPNTQPQGNIVQPDAHGNIDSNAESFGPWMIATRKGRKFNSGKDINNGLTKNRENTGAGGSRFQLLEQVTDDREHPTHAAVTDIPSTSHQLNTANPYQIFTANHEDRTKTPARRKQHITAFTAKPQKKTPTSSLNPIRNPFQQSTFTLRDLPHANPRTESCFNPQPNPNHQQISPLVTTLDPKKHTVIFCENQNLSLGDVREVGSDQGGRLRREYEHLSDPPDDQHAVCVNNANAQAHPAVSMGENDGEEMSDEEDSMIEETPLALMHDGNGQH